MNLEKMIDKYENGEPIFMSEIPCKSRNYLRQEFKRLTDDGILVREQNGVYYKSYKTMFGVDGKMSISKYINKVYLDFDSGFLTGLNLANKFGFTTQNPYTTEITSNNSTTKQRKINISGYRLIVYKPVVKITNENKSALQFLDLMVNIDKYSELKGIEYKEKLKKFVEVTKVNFEYVKKYISLYPMCVYKNIYEGGLMNRLVNDNE